MVPWLLYTAGVISYWMAWKRLGVSYKKAGILAVSGMGYFLAGAIIHVGPKGML